MEKSHAEQPISDLQHGFALYYTNKFYQNEDISLLNISPSCKNTLL